MDVECIQCKGIFNRPIQRGRPAMKCPECRAPKTGRMSMKVIDAVPVPKLKSKNGLYNRFELLAYLEENTGRMSAQELAEVIRSLNGS